VIHHRDLGGRHHRVVVGQWKNAGAKNDGWARVGKARDERETRRDGLGGVREVLPDERLPVPQAICQNDGFPILSKNVGVSALGRMDRLREEAERHGHFGSALPSRSADRESRS
jgi:hypothetical protein